MLWCSYMYIPLTLAWLDSKLGQLATSPDLVEHIQNIKGLYVFLKVGVCIAINPCTHEYLCVDGNCSSAALACCWLRTTSAAEPQLLRPTCHL